MDVKSRHTLHPLDDVLDTISLNAAVAASMPYLRSHFGYSAHIAWRITAERTLECVAGFRSEFGFHHRGSRVHAQGETPAHTVERAVSLAIQTRLSDDPSLPTSRQSKATAASCFAAATY